jgi:hypothetical protein
MLDNSSQGLNYNPEASFLHCNVNTSLTIYLSSLLIPVGVISARFVSSFSPSLYLYEAEERDRVRKDSRRVEVKIKHLGEERGVLYLVGGGGEEYIVGRYPGNARSSF